jgi:plasmid stabilization system protein ParE
MEIQWTGKALSDLVRLHEFLAAVDRRSAARVIQALVAAPSRLRQFPRVGEKLDQFKPREVRRLLVREYEIRYEIVEHGVIVLRVWHTREER